MSQYRNKSDLSRNHAHLARKHKRLLVCSRLKSRRPLASVMHERQQFWDAMVASCVVVHEASTDLCREHNCRAESRGYSTVAGVARIAIKQMESSSQRSKVCAQNQASKYKTHRPTEPKTDSQNQNRTHRTQNLNHRTQNLIHRAQNLTHRT